MKLIDKDALVAKIERWIELLTNEKNQEGISLIDKLSLSGRIAELQEVKTFIDTLNVKEIGVDLGDPKGDKSAKHIIDTKTLEMKEVDLEKAIKDYMDIHRLHIKDGGRIVYENNDSPNFMCDFRDFSKHFFELGMTASNKAQKGEKVC